MNPRAMLIVHDSDQKDDHASAFLAAAGFDLTWTCPAQGESITDLADDISALIVYGGKYGIPDAEAYPFLSQEMWLMGKAVERDIPVLGLCLGAQLLAHELGAPVGPHPEGYHEYGYYRLQPTPEGREFFGTGLMALQSHYHQFGIPAGAVCLASSELFAHQAFRYGDKAFGLQFHPEASRRMLQSWIERRGERNRAPGAHSPARQLSDNHLYDAALGAWFTRFMQSWIAPALLRARAA
jgi:GMP synthase (glutamine-hydrolysing)